MSLTTRETAHLLLYKHDVTPPRLMLTPSMQLCKSPSKLMKMALPPSTLQASNSSVTSLTLLQLPLLLVLTQSALISMMLHITKVPPKTKPWMTSLKHGPTGLNTSTDTRVTPLPCTTTTTTQLTTAKATETPLNMQMVTVPTSTSDTRDNQAARAATPTSPASDTVVLVDTTTFTLAMQPVSLTALRLAQTHNTLKTTSSLRDTVWTTTRTQVTETCSTCSEDTATACTLASPTEFIRSYLGTELP